MDAPDPHLATRDERDIALREWRLIQRNLLFAWLMADRALLTIIEQEEEAFERYRLSALEIAYLALEES